MRQVAQTNLFDIAEKIVDCHQLKVDLKSHALPASLEWIWERCQLTKLEVNSYALSVPAGKNWEYSQLRFAHSALAENAQNDWQMR